MFVKKKEKQKLMMMKKPKLKVVMNFQHGKDLLHFQILAIERRP